MFNDFSVNYLGKFGWCIFPVRALVTLILAILIPLAFIVCFTFAVPCYAVEAANKGAKKCDCCVSFCSLILYIICLPFCAIVAVLIYVLFYIIAIILLPLWIFQNLCKSRKVNKRNKTYQKHKEDLRDHNNKSFVYKDTLNPSGLKISLLES